jgi:hypothetical protein
MPAVASSLTWRHVLVTVAAPNDAQMVPSADARASVSGLGAAAEDKAIRPFPINSPGRCWRRWPRSWPRTATEGESTDRRPHGMACFLVEVTTARRETITDVCDRGPLTA